MSTKRKLPTKLAQPIVKQSPRSTNQAKLNETRAVVSGGSQPLGKAVETVEISSDSSSDVSSDDEEVEAAGQALVPAKTNGDVDMQDADQGGDRDGQEEEGEPSFGDLVRANASEPIDVAAFDEANAGELSYPRALQLQSQSGASLGTVLSQALKTNDADLLESCLQVTEIDMIRSTIQRLQSPLAGTLLHKLAERLHRRPGRAGSLLVWVQWTLVTHGGYLATQPDLIQRLVELNKVIDERARSLQSLLSLKGKLDMLDAQMQLRRSVQNTRRADEEEDDEEDVIYVEGEEHEDEGRRKDLDMSDSEGELDLNGHLEDSDEEDDSEDGGLIDDEADETDDDSGAEDEVDHDDRDSDDEESDEGAELAPPPKKRR